MILRLYLILGSFCIYNCLSDSGINCFERSDDYRCKLSAKSPYRFVANNDTSRLHFPGCVEKKIWFIVRHGTRSSGAESLEQQQLHLPFLRTMILKKYHQKKSKLSTASFKKFDDWLGFGDDEIGKDKALKPEGVRELIGIGKRMRARFPTLFLEDLKTHYKIIHSNDSKSFESAKPFIEGLLGDEKDQRVIWNFPTPQEELASQFQENCDNWYKEVKRDPNITAEITAFQQTPDYQKIPKSVSKLVGFPINDFDILYMIYGRCCLETSWNVGDKSPWCDIFTLDQFRLLDYSGDLRYYVHDGYTNEMNYKQACPAIVDIFNFFKSENDITMKTYVSRTPKMLKLMTLLGLIHDVPLLTHESFQYGEHWRKWSLSHIGTFGANLAFVLYDCEYTGKSVVLLSQERLTQIPGCPSDKPCPLSLLEKLYPSTEEACKYEEICLNPHY